MASPTLDRRLGLTGNTAIKAPVAAVATTPVTQAGEQTIDGVALVTGDRVLCTAQANASTNGIWDVSTAAWTRSADADGTYDLTCGSQVAVAGGGHAAQVWLLTSPNPITVGTSNLAWSPNATIAFLATLAAGEGSSLIGFQQAGTGAITRDMQTKMREVQVTLQDFGGVCDGVTDDTAAVRDALASGFPVRVIGKASVVGEITLPAGAILYGHNPELDGFVCQPQDASITGGLHAWFKTPAASDVGSILLDSLGFWSNYSSDTYAGSTVFSVIGVFPNSGISHDYLRFHNLKFYDPSMNCISLWPRSGGVAQFIWVDKCAADVTVALDKTSRTANLVQALLEGVDWAGHTTSYGTITCVINLFVTNCAARGIRTLADVKRGTRRFTLDNLQTTDMSDCHNSIDGSFSGDVRNLICKQSSNLLPCKNAIEIQGEDINVEDVQWDSTIALGAIACAFVTAYAFPIEGAGAFHQSKRIRISRVNCYGVDHNAIRLLDVDTCDVRQVTVQQVSLSAVSLEHTNTGVSPVRNTVDGIENPFGIGGSAAVSIDDTAIKTRIGRINGRNARVSSANYRPLYRDGTEYVSDKSLTLIAGAVPGFVTNAASVSQVTTSMAEYLQAIELDDSSSGAVGCLVQNGATPCLPNETVSVRVWAKLGTATACSVRFQQSDGSSVLATTYTALNANSSAYTENVVEFSASDPACLFVIVALVAATDDGTVSATGTSRFTGLSIAEGTV